MRRVFQRHVLIPAQDPLLEGELAIPEGAAGLAIFAHGSGSRLYTTRHPRVAGALNQKGIGTLLLDLLSAQEEASESWSREPHLAIDLLAARLLAARNWLLCDRELSYL